MPMSIAENFVNAYLTNAEYSTRVKTIIELNDSSIITKLNDIQLKMSEMTDEEFGISCQIVRQKIEKLVEMSYTKYLVIYGDHGRPESAYIVNADKNSANTNHINNFFPEFAVSDGLLPPILVKEVTSLMQAEEIGFDSIVVSDDSMGDFSIINIDIDVAENIFNYFHHRDNRYYIIQEPSATGTGVQYDVSRVESGIETLIKSGFPTSREAREYLKSIGVDLETMSL